ncbi:nuclear factor 1 C-type-like [Oryctolagus cuniculus]|uniref:nuclear factor 1 C-type-like n=1 Tax=Oryctolagus cuniculus TaxID=9986 RepID=UPI003879025F
MDKSPFNSPSPQDSLRLCSFTQHHRARDRGAQRHHRESAPVLRPALPHHVHPAADGVHLLPAQGHPLPAASQPSGPAQRSRVAGLRPGQPAAWIAYSVPNTFPVKPSFVGLGPRDPVGSFQAQDIFNENHISL